MTERTVDDVLPRLADLTTAHVADGCLRVGVPVRVGPPGLRPVVPGTRLWGRALPARHAGSVDVFLEAVDAARPGDLLVVDDGGRADRACVGDLVVLEAQQAGLAGVVVWGLHRDTADLRTIGLPVLSLGACPTGPLSVDRRPGDALTRARLGDVDVTRGDVVLADDDGAVVVPEAELGAVVAAAERIRDVERRQAGEVRAGRSLREQLAVAEFVRRRAADPALTFRAHLRAVGGAIEE